MKNHMESEAIANKLHAAAIHLLRTLRKADGLSGLNSPRLSALSVVVFAGPISLGELANTEQVRPPTMTRIVNALEEQGLVVKTRDAADRRNVYLSATMKGKKLLIKSRERRIRPLSDQIEKLDEQEQQTLESAIGLLKKITSARLL